MTKRLTYSFVVKGKPTPQSRPRFVSRFNHKGSSVLVYDDCKKKKALDRIEIMQQMRESGMMQKMSGSIRATLIFHNGGATSKRTKELIGTLKPTMPDIDNLAKYYLDMMNDLVFVDDRFITELICKKLFSDKMYTEIKLEELS